MALLRFRELLLDLLRVQQPFGDSLPALFEDRQDRLVSEPAQDQRNDDEADDLREENLPIKTEGFPGFADHVSRAGSSKNCDVHINKQVAGTSAPVDYFGTRNKA